MTIFKLTMATSLVVFAGLAAWGAWYWPRKTPGANTAPVPSLGAAFRTYPVGSRRSRPLLTLSVEATTQRRGT